MLWWASSRKRDLAGVLVVEQHAPGLGQLIAFGDLVLVVDHGVIAPDHRHHVGLAVPLQHFLVEEGYEICGIRNAAHVQCPDLLLAGLLAEDRALDELGVADHEVVAPSSTRRQQLGQGVGRRDIGRVLDLDAAHAFGNGPGRVGHEHAGHDGGDRRTLGESRPPGPGAQHRRTRGRRARPLQEPTSVHSCVRVGRETHVLRSIVRHDVPSRLCCALILRFRWNFFVVIDESRSVSDHSPRSPATVAHGLRGGEPDRVRFSLGCTTAAFCVAESQERGEPGNHDDDHRHGR